MQQRYNMYFSYKNTYQTTETRVYYSNEFRETEVFHLDGAFLQPPQERDVKYIKQYLVNAEKY